MLVYIQPMYGFDVEVTGSGFAPVSTSHREVIPFWYLNRVGPGERIPVKVDPSNPANLIFDWDRLAATPAPAPGSAPVASSFGGGAAATNVTPANAAGELAQRLVPGTDTLADAMQAARDLAGSHGSGWRVGKMIGWGITLFVLLVMGAGLYFVSQIFGQVSDVTAEVSDQAAEALEEAGEAFGGGGGGAGGGGGGGGVGAPTRIEVERTAKGRQPVSFGVALPAGWVDLSASVPERQGTVLVDLVMKPTAGEARIVVTRSLRFMQDPAPANADITSIRKDYEREFGDSLVRSRLTELAGEPAVALDLAPGADGLQSRQVAVMRGGQVLLINLAAPKSTWRPMLQVFDQVLESWRWGSVST